MKQHLPIVFGYELWKKSETIKSNAQRELVKKFKLLRRAYDITAGAKDHIKSRKSCKMHNNLLFYAVQLAQLSDKMPSAGDNKNTRLRETKKKIKEHLTVLEKEIGSSDNIYYLDSLAKAKYYLNDLEAAGGVADQILKICLTPEKNSGYDRDEMQIIAQEAYALQEAVRQKI